MSFLQTRQLSVAMGSKMLFEKLSVTFNPGEIWGIFGPNGSGKTTLLHALAGLLSPTDGHVILDESPVLLIKPKERAKKIGLLFQEVVFPFPITALEAVLVGRYPHSTHWFRAGETDIQIAQKALKKAQLTGFEDRFVSTLSGGEKQRLALATLLAQEPSIYLLDEPTNHLDIEQKSNVLNELKRLAKKENKTVILSLHDIPMIKHYCDRLIVLEKSLKCHVGRVDELLTKERLTTIFSETDFDLYGV
jgi:iron complex transport system ATP-binding protein